MATQQQRFKPTPADELRVLAILRESDRPRVWSSIACELHGLRKATIEHVRGVRDACRSLEAKGLVREVPPELGSRPTLRFEAVAPDALDPAAASPPCEPFSVAGGDAA